MKSFERDGGHEHFFFNFCHGDSLQKAMNRWRYTEGARLEVILMVKMRFREPIASFLNLFQSWGAAVLISNNANGFDANLPRLLSIKVFVIRPPPFPRPIMGITIDQFLRGAVRVINDLFAKLDRLKKQVAGSARNP